MDPRLTVATKQTDRTNRARSLRRALTIVAVCVALGIAGARMIAQSGTVTSYEDNFQSYGTQKNVPGWVDTSVGSSRPSANGLYKTWPDPLQGSHGNNVVYGSKSSSGSGYGSSTVSSSSVSTNNGGGNDDDDDDDNCHGNDLTAPRSNNNGGGSNDDCDHDDDDDDDDCHDGHDLTSPRTTGVSANHDDDDDCDDDNNSHRTGTFSTYTRKTFAAAGGFSYRGRFIRTNSDSRIGMTILSGYPERDKYYLIGVGKSSFNGKLTMQLFSNGAGSPTGTVDSRFTPDPDKWYSFAIRADDVGGKTLIKARFWLSTATEPSTWSIDSTDAASGRLATGRIGIWAAVKGANYVDDLSIKSPVDQVAPVITVTENNTALTEGKKFKYAPVLTIKATDDITTNPVITATLDGAAYTSGSAVTAQGNHTLFVRAVDGAGNASQVTIHFYVDTIAPTVIVQSPANGSLTSQNVTIAVQSTDATLPLTTTATLNGANWTLTQPITEEREHTLVVTVTDGVGNTTVTAPIKFKIDKTPPTWTLKANGTPLTTDTRVFGEDVRITLEVQDPNSPSKTILLNDSNYVENTPITADGEYRVGGSVSDGAGNRVTIPQRRFIIDKTAPEFVITGNGQPMKRYYDGPVNLAITITDRTATTTVAKLNTVAMQFPRNVTAEGRYLLEVTVTDALGHARSLPQPIEFFVDLTAPVVTLFANGQTFPQNKIFADDVVVTIRIDDLTPPSSTVTLDSDTVELPKTVSSETPQPHKISAVVSDAVGRTTRIEAINFIIDKTPPSVTIRNGMGGAVLEEGSYHRIPVRPFIDVTDATPTITDALLDGVRFESGTQVTAEGEHILTGTVKDGALRTTTFGPLKFFIDTTPPTGVFMEGTAAFPNGQVLKRNVSARVKTDDRSLPVEVVIHLDGRPEAYQTDTPITEEALHTLTATMKDAAGNTADVPPVTVRIDKTPPAVTLTANGQAFPSGYAFNKDIAIDAGVDEAFQEKWAVINPGNHRVALPYVHAEEGEFTVTGYATDVAGNEGHGPTLPFILEKTPPTVVTVIDGVEAVPNNAYKANVVITFQVSGGLTPRTVTATVNGQPYTAGTPYSTESTKAHPHVIGGKVVTGSGVEASIPPMPFILDQRRPGEEPHRRLPGVRPIQCRCGAGGRVRRHDHQLHGPPAARRRRVGE